MTDARFYTILKGDGLSVIWIWSWRQDMDIAFPPRSFVIEKTYLYNHDSLAIYIRTTLLTTGSSITLHRFSGQESAT